MEVWRRDMTAVFSVLTAKLLCKMTDLINAGQTMTSLQIAEVTGKKHCDVLRAIRNMEPSWEKITARKFASRFKINELANGVKKETPYYELTKTECLYIATKFNDEARARLILRWEELENEKLAALQQPQQPTEAETLRTDEKCSVFFADSEEMCKFVAFKQERHLHKVAHENINEIISAEVSQGSNALQQMCASPCLNSTHPRTFLFMFKQENQVCLYNGSPVTFKLGDGTTTVNATQMAKPFGKLVADWQRQKSTQEFLKALSADMGIPISALIQTVKGGIGEQGTWMHEDAALEFARWLSPKFAIWCNARIKELLTAPQQPTEAEILPPPH